MCFGDPNAHADGGNGPTRSFTTAYLYDGQSFSVLAELTGQSSSRRDRGFGRDFGQSNTTSNRLTPSTYGRTDSSSSEAH